MSKVLAVLTPARRGDSLIDEDIRVALAGAGGPEVRVLYVIDRLRGDHLKDCLNDRGFVGPGPAENVGRISNDAAQLAGNQALDEASERAALAGVECSTAIVWGDLLETVVEEDLHCGAERILMSQSRLGPFISLFGEKAVSKLRRHFGDKLVTVPSEGDGPLA